MTTEQLSVVILGIFGVVLQLVLKYAPGVSTWYQNSANKGTIALVASAVIGAVYVGLACTPFAAQLGISLACSQDSIFVLLKAIFLLATTQQLTYLYTRGSK